MRDEPYRADDNPLLPVPGAVAYRCDDCDKSFAESAVKQLTVGRTHAVACPVCGHGLRKAVEGRVVAPFTPLLLRAFAFPLREPTAMLALGAFVGVASYVPFGGWFSSAIVVGYLFAIVRKTSRGGDRAPEPADFVDLWDLFAPLVRYALVIVCALVPLLAATLLGAPSPVVIAMGVVGALFVPGGMIAASEESGFLFNPIGAVGIVRRIPGPYLVLVVCLALVALLGAGVAMVATALQAALTMIPVLPRLVASTLGLYAPFTAARMLGLLVREHVEEL
jgi:DNA-directed RNA polymerase subunit RPC12/RpoP